jgi:hypothetical protein
MEAVEFAIKFYRDEMISSQNLRTVLICLYNLLEDKELDEKLKEKLKQE